MKASLYRHYDGAGNLLYLGMSIKVLLRLAKHRDRSSWFDDIRRVEITPYSSVYAARKAEMRAIERERPLYNRARKAMPRSMAKIRCKPFEPDRTYAFNDVARELRVSPDWLVEQFDRDAPDFTMMGKRDGAIDVGFTGAQLNAWRCSHPGLVQPNETS